MPAASSDTFGEPTSARERRRQALLTLLVALLLLFCAAWYAWSYVRDRGEPAPAPAGTSSGAAPTCGPRPEQVQVNVYNTTSRDGLAASVGKQLRERGFDVRTVANDPKKAEITGVGEVRHGAKGAAAAELVRGQLPEATTKQDDRPRESVDLVLGEGFKTLGAPPSPSPSC